MPANKGQFDNDNGHYSYRVVDYKMTHSDRHYAGSGYSSKRANDPDLEWVRVEVENGKGQHSYATIYGPYLDEEDLAGILGQYYDDEDYTESFS